MIDPRELRIGNLVQVLETDLFAMVIGIFSKEGKNYQIGIQTGGFYIAPENINPIPITPEWLERFGFEKGRVGDHDYNLNEFVFVNAEDGDWDELCLDVFVRWNLNGKHKPYATPYITCIEYVHQLQNLCYCLTGQELTLKEKV